MRVWRLILASFMILAIITNVYGSQQSTAPPSFRDVPGITDSEIKAIDGLRARDASFTYGVPFSSEAFFGSNGAVDGFAALFCGWLTELFDIPFAPVICANPADALESGVVDFAGVTDSNTADFSVTGAIMDRPVKMFRLAGGEPLQDIALTRPVSLAFVSGATSVDTILGSMDFNCETVIIPGADAAYQALKTGEADAFFDDGCVMAYFQDYGDVVAEDYLPLALNSLYLATKSTAYTPIISVVQKALLTGSGIRMLELYNDGLLEYEKYRLNEALTDTERAYIQDHTVVPIVAQYYNYPISFYNAADKQWQGIVLDLLAEVTKLTGMSFQVVNAPNAEFSALNKMLQNEDAAFITRLVRTKDREGLYLWSDTSVMDDKYVLISRSDFHYISLNEILHVNVGLVKDTAQANLFRSWFPNNVKTVEYGGLDAAISALDRGEMDLVMSSYSQLLYLTNYQGRSGYKANFVFGSALDANLGFNINEADLRSILDKALGLINTTEIAERWSYKTFTQQTTQLIDIPNIMLPVSAAVIAIIAVIVLVILRRRGGKYRKPPVKTLRAPRRVNNSGQRSTIMDKLVGKKLLNFLFLLPVAIMIAFSLFFARLTTSMQQNLLNEKFAEKKLEVAMMANNADSFISRDNDWVARHEYYQQSLIYNMEELDRSYMTFAVVYDKDLKRLSKQVNYNGGFDPMVYPNFVTEVLNNQTMGDVVINFKPTDAAEREVYIHYRWIPTGTTYDDRFLVVVAISKLTIITQTDGWFKVGSVTLIIITTLLNIAMVSMIRGLAGKK